MKSLFRLVANTFGCGYVHSPLEKSLMERVNQYFKDRTEC